jgi:hypothetical protein
VIQKRGAAQDPYASLLDLVAPSDNFKFSRIVAP